MGNTVLDIVVNLTTKEDNNMENEGLKVLEEAGVLLTGHFILPSGKHSNRYVQCARLLQYPDKASKFLKSAVEKIKNLDFDIILGPAIGGVLIAYELGRQLKKPILYIEKENGEMTLKRGLEIKKGQKILIAEDVITSGKTVKESIELIETLGGEVVGIVCIVNKESLTMNQKIYSCINLNLKSYTKEECPFCKEKLPLQTGK